MNRLKPRIEALLTVATPYARIQDSPSSKMMWREGVVSFWYILFWKQIIPSEYDTETQQIIEEMKRQILEYRTERNILAFRKIVKLGHKLCEKIAPDSEVVYGLRFGE